MKLFLVTLILIVGSLLIIISYTNSDMLFTSYLRFYHVVLHNGEYDEFLKEAKLHRQKGEFDQFIIKTKRLIRAYPHKEELHGLLATYYLTHDETIVGARYALRSLKGTSADAEILGLLIPALFKEKMYQDISAIMQPYRDQELRSMREGLLAYGAALFELGEYKKARSILTLIRGYSANSEYYYYMGKSSEYTADALTGIEKTAMLESALFYFREGYHYNKHDLNLKECLTRILKKLGRSSEAAAVYIK